MQAGMRDTSLTGSIHVIQCHPAAQARSKVAAIELGREGRPGSTATPPWGIHDSRKATQRSRRSDE
jgi:hypothetical protein